MNAEDMLLLIEEMLRIYRNQPCRHEFSVPDPVGTMRCRKGCGAELRKCDVELP